MAVAGGSCGVSIGISAGFSFIADKESSAGAKAFGSSKLIPSEGGKSLCAKVSAGTSDGTSDGGASKELSSKVGAAAISAGGGSCGAESKDKLSLDAVVVSAGASPNAASNELSVDKFCSGDVPFKACELPSSNEGSSASILSTSAFSTNSASS